MTGGAAKAPRIPMVARARAGAEQRRIGDLIFDRRGEEYGGPSAYLLHAPELAERFEQMREHIRNAGLPADLLQLATLVVARHWSVDYVWNIRVPMAKAAGLGDAVIDAIRNRARPVFADPAHDAIYDYAMEMLGPDGVSDATHARARNVLGSDALMIELAALIGLYTFLAFQGRCVGIPVQAGGEVLPR